MTLTKTGPCSHFDFKALLMPAFRTRCTCFFMSSSTFADQILPTELFARDIAACIAVGIGSTRLGWLGRQHVFVRRVTRFQLIETPSQTYCYIPNLACMQTS